MLSGAAARAAVAPAWRNIWQQFVATGEFFSLQLSFGACFCLYSLSCPGTKQGPAEILRRFGPVAPGQLRTWHCSKAMERQQKKGILNRQSAPTASGPSQALLGGAGDEGMRRQLIKPLLAQELPSQINAPDSVSSQPYGERRVRSHTEQFNQLRKQFVLSLFYNLDKLAGYF